MVRRLAQPRDLLEELVGHARADLARLVAHRGEILDLVGEDDSRRERSDPLERLREQLRLPLRPLARELGRLDLDERPAETRRDPFGERRLPRARRPEEDDRLRRPTAYRSARSGRSSGRITRRSMISFASSNPLSSAHSPGWDEQRAELGERLGDRRRRRDSAREQDEIVRRLVAARLEERT